MASTKRNHAVGAAGLGSVHRITDDTPVNSPPRLNPQRNFSRIAMAEIYDGLRHIGTIERHKRRFRALDADSRRIGDFPREREATQAITSRAGELRASRDAK
jgi:hypothetical protein